MPEPDDRRSRLRPRLTAAPYLSLLLIAPVGYHFGLTATGDASLGPLLLLGCFVVAVVTWILARPSGTWRVSARAWLLLVIVLWTFLVLREGADGVKAGAAAIFVPMSMLLIWIRAA